MDILTVCRYCQVNISPNDYFCPNCGKKLKEKPQSVSIGRQIVIYLLSALLPPLGLWPAIKYLRQGDSKSKQIGIVAIVLTLISTIVTVWLSFGFIAKFNQLLSGQLNSFEGTDF